MDVLALSKDIDAYLKQSASEAERLGECGDDGCAWVFAMDEPEASGMITLDKHSEHGAPPSIGIAIFVLPGDELDRDDLAELLQLNREIFDAALVAVQRDETGAFDVLLHRRVRAEGFKADAITAHVEDLSRIVDTIVGDDDEDDEPN